VRNSSSGWPRVNAAFEYFKPLRFEDEFEAHIRIVEIAERRIRYSCSLTCGGDRIATGLMTIVCVEKKPDQPMKSTPIPAEILARLQVAPEGGPNS
jgi:acyl-CoA thioesterase FadM